MLNILDPGGDVAGTPSQAMRPGWPRLESRSNRIFIVGRELHATLFAANEDRVVGR